MDKYPDQKRAVQYLYPPVDPFDQRMMDVGDGHKIYVEQCGNPSGIPVVVLHGGPGGGCSPAMRRYFDPAVFRVVLFDQRGCGRSRPHAVLRGVFTMTKAEIDWFYGGGAGKFWPEVWARFVALIPEDERGDLVAAYHKRLFSGDRMEETKYGRAWASWENALASIHSNGMGGEAPGEYARAFSRLENHYFINGGFLEFDGQILANMDRIADIPGTVVQGRYDMICPPDSAYAIVQRWPRSTLKMVRNAGHALSEPGISAELVRTMDRIGQSEQRP